MIYIYIAELCSQIGRNPSFSSLLLKPRRNESMCEDGIKNERDQNKKEGYMRVSVLLIQGAEKHKWEL